MSIYKLVVLGDGGVGKTALVIQASVKFTASESTFLFIANYHIWIAVSESFRRDLRPYHRRLVSKAGNY
jgi:hypothetical protein